MNTDPIIHAITPSHPPEMHPAVKTWVFSPCSKWHECKNHPYDIWPCDTHWCLSPTKPTVEPAPVAQEKALGDEKDAVREAVEKAIEGQMTRHDTFSVGLMTDAVLAAISPYLAAHRADGMPGQPRDAEGPTDGELASALAEKFLAWPLPASLCSDLIATMPGAKHRIGTNLMTCVEAEQMMTEVVLPTLREKQTPVGMLDWVKRHKCDVVFDEGYDDIPDEWYVAHLNGNDILGHGPTPESAIRAAMRGKGEKS